MKNRSSHARGFTLVEIMIVVAIIGLLAAIAIPNFIRARTTSQQDACINNIRQIDAAIQQWAIDNHAATGAHLQTTDVQPYLGRGSAGSAPYCPSDSTQSFDNSYTVGQSGLFIVGNIPVCFINPSNHVIPVGQ